MIWRITIPTKIITGTRNIHLSKAHDTEIAPNVNWPKSKSFVHVDEKGNLSPALTEQFLPARAALLADYWNKSWYSHYHWVHLCPHNLSDPTP
jgi:hypothetical protein